MTFYESLLWIGDQNAWIVWFCIWVITSTILHDITSAIKKRDKD